MSTALQHINQKEKNSAAQKFEPTVGLGGAQEIFSIVDTKIYIRKFFLFFSPRIFQSHLCQRK